MRCYGGSRIWMIALTAVWAASCGEAWAAEEREFLSSPAVLKVPTVQSALTADEWDNLDRAVDRGLEFLVRQQREDGSFETVGYRQPAVTSFCVMAFLSRGHMPGEGPYGQSIVRAIDYVLSTQQPSGLFCAIPRASGEWSIKGTYNHAIAGVMLGEVYGMSGSRQQRPIREAIERALRFTRGKQQEPKQWADDRGGWRYLSPTPGVESDLSITAWHLMFYRSAQNAGFVVPESAIESAVAFAQRCFDPRVGSFAYGLRGQQPGQHTRPMAGAGILALSLAGHHQSEMAQQAGRFVLAHPFDEFNGGVLGRRGCYFYGAYHCSQAMFQLGGDDWAEFFRVLQKTLVDNQRADGSWDRDAHREAVFGTTYSTALAVLALTPPYQLLPIYQR